MINNYFSPQENSKKTYQDGFAAGYDWIITGIVAQLRRHGDIPFNSILIQLGSDINKWKAEEVLKILLSMLDHLNNEIDILNRTNEKLASENEAFTHAIISLQDQLNRKNYPE